MRTCLVAAALLAACTEVPGDVGKGPGVRTSDTPTLPFDHPPVGGTGGGGTGGSGGGAGATSSATHTQRLSVAQLRHSLPVVLGNDGAGAPVTWKIGNAVGFDARSSTLGEADYLVRVDEDLEPSPLYVKFMFDMARDSCNRVITADAAKPQAQRTLTRYTDVDQNLRSLRLAFHGVKVTGGAGIATYRKLYDAAAAGGNSTEGWRAVCIALLTAPEYHFY